MQTPSWLLRAMPVFQKNRHYGMNSLYSVLLLTFLLSTAYCDDSQSVNDSTNFVTESDITDIDVQGKYDTETTNYTLSKTTSGRNVFQTNDFVSEAVSTAFTSSLIKNDKIERANKAPTITYSMTRTAVNVDGRTTAMHTSNSGQTQKLEHEHSSMTAPTTKFLPTTPVPVDACDTDQVEVTNSPVLVNAFTNETNCNLLVTASNDTSILVKLLNSSLSNATTYFYMKKLGNLPQNCAVRYISLSINFAPCITKIRGGRFTFYFQNTMVTLEMRTIDVKVSPCSETQINASEYLQCNYISYTTEIKKNVKTFKYGYSVWETAKDVPWGNPRFPPFRSYRPEYRTVPAHWKYRTLNLRVMHYLAMCACDCIDKCMCTLGYREWLSTCIDGKDSNTTHAEMIVYEQTISGLSFANTGMNEIQQNALLGLEMLEVIILEHNSLSILPATICRNLPQLKVLKLGYNILTNLTTDLFKGQCKLKLIGIHLNNNKLTFLAPDLFNSTSNLQHLDLSHNRLVHISNDTFSTLAELHTLNLKGNHISYLGVSDFNSQTKLKYLYLSDNVIAVVHPDLFDSLERLSTLDLSDNHISVLPVDVFDSLERLSTLDLSDNHISVLPVDVFDSLERLSTLDLSDNHISVLPVDVFDSLERLSYLYLSDNHISVLPADVFDSLGRLLNVLDLSGNYVSVLPVRLFNTLRLLRNLDLSDNHISVLSATVFNSLVELIYLDLGNNYISVLPMGVFDLVGVSATKGYEFRTLDLHANNISTLHVNVFKSPRWVLFSLDLSHNRIHDLPSDVFKTLTRLKNLDLSHNAIEIIPSELLISQANLLILNLSCNSIPTLHVNVFKTLWRLCVLDLRHNFFQEVPSDVFQALPKLKTLDLSHNAVDVIPNELLASHGNLLTLDLSSNSISFLQPEFFLALKNLTTLNLHGNNLTSMETKTLETLTALQVLDLSKNRITEFLEPLFLSTINLQSLQVSENYLTSTPFQCFVNLKALTYLNLSKNSLTSLPSFNAQRQLQVLDLSKNRLVRLIPAMFNNLGNLTFLSLCENDLVTLPSRIFYHMNKLLFLNASHNAIQQIDRMIFSKESKLQTFDMRGNEMSKVTYDSFSDQQSATVIVDKYATCCFMDKAQCVSLKPRPEYLTCNRMLPDVLLRISVWIFGLSAFICNGIAYLVRSRKRQANKVQTLFISNLALSDLLMGVNMLILASGDVFYREFFPSQVHVWRHGFPCKVAGFLSIFSSEGSVFFIALISIDRMLGIKYPFGGGLRLTTKWARICVALVWLMAFLISVIPIGLATDKGNVFSISEVCIGIPIVRRHLSTYRSESVQINITFMATRPTYEYVRYWLGVGYRYVSGVEVEPQQSIRNISYDVADITESQIAPIFSILVFIGVNLACFFIVAFCYIYIFIKANETTEGAVRTLDRDEQVRMAKKMFAIVFTDFCCWVPLCFICILAQCGVLQISPEMYAWTVGFILPINSSINPFLYVLYEAIADHRRKKQEERNERENIEMQVRWRPMTHFGSKFDQQ